MWDLTNSVVLMFEKDNIRYKKDMLLFSWQFSQNLSLNWASAAQPTIKLFFCHNKAGGVRGNISGVSDPSWLSRVTLLCSDWLP